MADIMSTIKAFIKRHPVPTYYVLTFAISWGGLGDGRTSGCVRTRSFRAGRALPREPLSKASFRPTCTVF